MEENFEQISEGENYPNYNYEEFVRTITKEDNTISKRNKFEEYEYKDYQKEFYFNSTQSSDVTSISFSQTENLSQTSENIFISGDSKQNVGLDTQKQLNYFYGIENYFRKIEPEKFEEYKNSRNFLPKKRRDNNINNIKNEKNPKISLNDSEENKNSSNNFQYPNNIYYYPVNGNMIYYIYNNFYLNFLNIQQAQAGNKNNENIKIKEENKNEKIQEEEKKEGKKDKHNEIDKRENKKITEIKDEYDNIYIIKKKNIKKNNNNMIQNDKDNYYKNNKQERNNEKRYKDKNYNYHYYNSKNNSNYYNNDGYNKYNGNKGKRNKKFYFENNFYKKKYHNDIYY